MAHTGSIESPDGSKIDALLALCRSGRLAEAEAEARRLLRDFPAEAAVNDILAGILMAQGRLDEAVPLYQNVVAARPDHADAHFALGNIYLYKGNPQAAVEHYSKALDLRPGLTEAQTNLGAAYLALGSTDKAIQILAKAVELGPNSADAHTNLGIALKTAGRTQEAVRSFRKALEIAPQDAETHNNLGAAQEDLGEFDAAIRSYRGAVGINPTYAEAHCNLGNVLAKTGDHLAAIEAYKKAIELRPDFAEAHNSLGVSLKEKSWFEDAEHYFRRAVQIRPDFAQAHDNLATALRRQGKLKEAEASARAALEHNPSFAEAYYNLGLARHLGTQYEAAVEAYEKALELKPDFDDARESLGQALQDLGRFDEAITHFKSVGSRMSNARTLECYFALGGRKDYEQCLQGLCVTDPTNIWVAGISAFAAQQWKTENPYPFCPHPLDFIFSTNVGSQVPSFETFAENLEKEIEKAETVWAPPQNTTVKGYHTLGNLFQMGTPSIVKLQEIISRQIAAYRNAFADRSDGIITQWPEKSGLSGWHIRLLKDGYQEAHIHPSGWVSGVIYLKLPRSLEGEEGAITFTLHGRDLPILDHDIPTVRHTPKVGDLVLFPSSLYHYTSPFHSDGERHVVAFDLCPVEAKAE